MIRIVDTIWSLDLIKTQEEETCQYCDVETAYRVLDNAKDEVTHVCCGKCFRRLKNAMETVWEQYEKKVTPKRVHDFVMGILFGILLFQVIATLSGSN